MPHSRASFFVSPLFLYLPSLSLSPLSFFIPPLFLYPPPLSLSSLTFIFLLSFFLSFSFVNRETELKAVLVVTEKDCDDDPMLVDDNTLVDDTRDSDSEADLIPLARALKSKQNNISKSQHFKKN